jgi:amino acid transporter
VEAPPHPSGRRWLRAILGTVGATLGALFALAVWTVGHCSAFGGTCPAVPPAPLEDDVFGGLALGLGLVVLSVVLALRPTRRGLLLASIAMVVVVLPLAYVLAVASRRGGF